MMSDTEYNLDDIEYAYLHDIIYDLTNRSFSNEDIDDVISQLPPNIKFEALEFGFNDTVVRDNFYVWYRDNFAIVAQPVSCHNIAKPHSCPR